MKKSEKISLFLDSGAHSLFNKEFAAISGKKGIHSRVHAKYEYADSKEFKEYLDAYIAFIHENKEYLDIYVNLDVIFNPEKTWEVQKYMEAQGLSPLPVYHFGEDIKWLKKYVDEYEYIGIGGLGQDITKKKFIQGMGDPVFSYVCDTENNLPKVKVHGFAMTSLDLMLRYPWYSVDSTSWVLVGRFGSVFVPRIKNGKCIYDENSFQVTVSDRSPSKKEEGKHISTFSEMEKEIILGYFEKKGYKLGESEFREEPIDYQPKDNERWHGKGKGGKREVEEIVEPGLCNDYKQRDELNIIYFLDLEKSMPEWPWPFKLKKQGFGLRG